MGELGLGGELRAVAQVERRLSEAARMGFRTAYLSPRARPRTVPAGLRVVEAADVKGLIGEVFGG